MVCTKCEAPTPALDMGGACWACVVLRPVGAAWTAIMAMARADALALRAARAGAAPC